MVIHIFNSPIMTSETTTSFQIPEKHYTAIFNALPGMSYLLQNNAPQFITTAEAQNPQVYLQYRMTLQNR